MKMGKLLIVFMIIIFHFMITSFSFIIQSGNQNQFKVDHLNVKYVNDCQKLTVQIQGSKSCLFDLKTYYRVNRALRNKEMKLGDLSIPELLVYIQASNFITKNNKSCKFYSTKI